MPRKPALPAPPDRWSNGFDWVTLIGLIVLHAGALSAPFFFTWKSVLLTLGLGWLTGAIGICLGYHRLLTHQSFETYRPVRSFIALLGTLAGQGPPITWVAVHRKHHLYSDEEDDPHSPRHGGWWSHMVWLIPFHSGEEWQRRFRRYAPDLLAEPFMRFLGKAAIACHLFVGLALYAAGVAFWDVYTGVSFVVYGIFLRLVYVLHVTWAVNSASHMWGYRNYETADDSRNLWWVGLLSYGEGWHNNHHAFQRGARHGHRWWELDMTYAAIWLMERVGLAWNVVRTLPPPLQRAGLPKPPVRPHAIAPAAESPSLSGRPHAASEK